MDSDVGYEACINSVYPFIQDKLKSLVGEKFVIESLGGYIFCEIVPFDDEEGKIMFLYYNPKQRKIVPCSPTSSLYLKFKQIGDEYAGPLPDGKSIEDLLEIYSEEF